jgi:hypothetical protein
VSDGSEQDREAELARQAEALREQGMPIFRAVQEYITGAGAAEESAISAARQVSEAMDRGMAEVIAAVGNMVGLAGTAANTSQASGSLSALAMITVDADVITVSDSETVRPENLNRLLARASRDGIAGLSTTQTLVLVLIWLLTIGAPVVQQALPPEAQTLLSDEYGTISIAIAITLVIFSRKR